jgi:hypothetical protein
MHTPTRAKIHLEHQRVCVASSMVQYCHVGVAIYSHCVSMHPPLLRLHRSRMHCRIPHNVKCISVSADWPVESAASDTTRQTLCTRPYYVCGAGAHTNTYVHVHTEAIYNYYGNHCNVHNDNKCPLRSLHINLAPHK